jgi:hypothetical protein
MNREAVATRPIPASGHTLIGLAAATDPFQFHWVVSVT